MLPRGMLSQRGSRGVAYSLVVWPRWMEAAPKLVRSQYKTMGGPTVAAMRIILDRRPALFQVKDGAYACSSVAISHLPEALIPTEGVAKPIPSSTSDS